MSRTGKIARLPEPIREQVNEQLQDGHNGQDIIAWLNANDEVKAILAQDFNGQEINDTNLSQWRKGGFREWEAQQVSLEEARRIVAEGRELGRTAEKMLTDNLAIWLTGRYIVATRKLIENEDDAAAWKLLREVCHDVVALRRGDHGAEWLRLEQERVKLLRQKNTRERRKESKEENPPLPPMDDDEKDRRFREIFGMRPS